MHTRTDLLRPAFNPALGLLAAAAWPADLPGHADAVILADDDDPDWLDFLATGRPADLHSVNNPAGLPWLRAPVLLSY